MHKLIIFLSLFSAFHANSQHKPVDAVTILRIKQGVAKAAETTVTISSDFTQEKEMNIMKEKIITRGRFYFKKERLLRWEYIHPFNYVIAIRGDAISILDEGVVKSFNTQSNKVFAEVNRIIIGSVNGTLLDEASFTSCYNQNNSHYIVSLYPVSPTLKESLERIAIYFSKEDYTVDKLEMFETAGDYTRITFTEKQLNQPIPDEVFILR